MATTTVSESVPITNPASSLFSQVTNFFKSDPSAISSDTLRAQTGMLRMQFEQASKLSDTPAQVRALLETVLEAERLGHEGHHAFRNSPFTKTAMVVGGGAGAVALAAGGVTIVTANPAPLIVAAGGYVVAQGSLLSVQFERQYSQSGRAMREITDIQSGAFEQLRGSAKADPVRFGEVFYQAVRDITPQISTTLKMQQNAGRGEILSTEGFIQKLNHQVFNSPAP